MRWQYMVMTMTCATGLACAEPNPPLPPPVDLLIVANTSAGSLSILATQTSLPATTLPLGMGPISAIAARNDRLLAVLPDADLAVVVDLRGPSVLGTIPLPPGAAGQAAEFVNDSVAYVAASGLNLVVRINIETGVTSTLAVGQYPAGLVNTRGRLFVLNANVAPCPPPDDLCTEGPSWLTVIDPVTNARAEGRDSIPIPGPGNARYAVVGGDGLLYTMSRGDAAPSRLSIVDPVDRDEIGSFGGFGADPGPLASDAVERLFISSTTEGLMEFNTRTRTVVRGSGTGVAIPDNASVAVDPAQRVYAIEMGSCTGAGTAHVLDSTLVAIRTVALGPCPGPAVVTRFAAEEP